MSGSRRQYPFHLIEPKWQQTWEQQQAFRAFNPGERVPENHPFAQRHGADAMITSGKAPQKFYILDMFPYPSGAGLHVGHPEGYTATDILARYRRACGFNVLHPMGWDSFGLPAEQFAIREKKHPSIETKRCIANFTRQIKSLGFSYDWSREIATTDSEYFHWTQWIFLQIYNSWFNPETNNAEPISTLTYPTECNTEESRRAHRDSKRLAFVAEAPVNWCPELGTVLANEEVIDGKSEVGGFPVIRKPMRQWMLRITAYAEKLLADLDTIDWTDSLKEMQRNWIGRSEGAEVDFQIADGGLRVAHSFGSIRVFTTRPDTLFGATYMVLAPEHKLVDLILRFADQDYRVNKNITAKWINIIEPSGVMLSSGSKSLPVALEIARGRKDDLIEIESAHDVSNCLASDHRTFLAQQKQLRKHAEAVRKYRDEVSRKSDLERTELAKEKTGVFTGAYAINPVNGEKIPIWIADYVLASYGTGAIMAVPAHDERDFEFAIKFKLPIRAVVKPPLEWLSKNGAHLEANVKADGETLTWTFCELVNVAANEGKSFESQTYEIFTKQVAEFKTAFGDSGVAINSGFISGLPTPEAKKKITDWLEEKGLGKKTINYKLRDWLFSRQRYWGEPFPIIWKKDAAGNLYHEALPESSLPLLPPSLEDYKPTADGQPPLARAKDWLNLPDGSVRETNTMPQWAGSCWYYLRYLDAKNALSFVGKDAETYWMGAEGYRLKVEGFRKDAPSQPEPLTLNPSTSTPGVDLYVGGTEHAVLHLLYARFWHKVLFDLGYVSTPEPFFKLVNQGLILGEDGQKMSKSRGNVVNPDDVLKEFGADAFRLYEMFMGPLQDTKPWNTRGVEGVYRFLGRVWRLFVDEKSETAFEQAETLTAENAEQRKELLDLILLAGAITDTAATPAQLKTLHACIKKVTEDLDGMRFNTAISAMMVFINDAMTWETKPVSVLKTFLQLLAPFSPHLAEELWAKLATFNLQPSTSLAYSPWPKFDAALLVESEIEIPVSVNGKMRDVIKVAVDADNATIEALAKSSEKVKQFMEGKAIKKIIIVPKKMVNIVVG